MKLFVSAFMLFNILCASALADPIEEANSYAVRIKSTVRFAFAGEEAGTSNGAGFLVDRARGWILTNALAIMAMDWNRIILVARSNRSARTPPIGPMMTTGENSAIAIKPSQVGEWVNSQVNQPTPTRCIHSPIRERLFPAVYFV